MNCQFLIIPQKKIAKNDRENDRESFNQTNELTGYRNSADL